MSLRRLACVAVGLAAATMAHGAVPTPPLTPVTDMAAINALVDKAGFNGDILVSDRRAPHLSITLDSSGVVGALPQARRGDDDGLTWRWASVTKQIVAVLVMQEVEKGKIDLDSPVSTYLPAFRGPNARTVTVRQLLQHRSGLPNPDDTLVGPDGLAAYYRPDFAGNRDPLTGYCAGPAKGPPGGAWSYNNCDYIVLGALLEAVTGTSWATLFRERIAAPLGMEEVGVYPGERFTRIGRIDGKPEPAIDLASFGAAGGLYGPVDQVLLFDFALMDGKLLGPEALAELWRGDPALGFMALGQWSFEVPIAGCKGPVRIVERRGAIGGVEVRNFIIPGYHAAIVAFSDSAPFDFGEVWQGKGFSHDLISAAICGKKGIS